MEFWMSVWLLNSWGNVCGILQSWGSAFCWSPLLHTKLVSLKIIIGLHWTSSPAYPYLHSFIHSFIYLFIFFLFFIYLFIYSFVYFLFFYLFIYLFIYLFTYLLIYLVIYLFIYSFIYLFTHTYSFWHFLDEPVCEPLWLVFYLYFPENLTAKQKVIF